MEAFFILKATIWMMIEICSACSDFGLKKVLKLVLKDILTVKKIILQIYEKDDRLSFLAANYY